MNIHNGIVPCADRCSLLCSVFMPYAIAVEAEAFAVMGYRLANLRHERQDGSLRIAQIAFLHIRGGKGVLFYGSWGVGCLKKSVLYRENT